MQIRRARSFGLTQLCAYFKNGGHRLSTDLAVKMCVRLKGYYTLDSTTHVNSHNDHSSPSSISWKKAHLALIYWLLHNIQS